MADIKAADVAKLRNITGAGMMDCKAALVESNGDFQVAIEILRKKGQKVANKRADRDACEGVVLAKTSANGKSGILVVLNCETDFVAKNQDFVAFTQQIADLAAEKLPSTLDELKSLVLPSGVKIEDEVMNKTGVIGEKLALSFYHKVEGEVVATYIHPGNKVASIVGFSKAVEANIGRDIAMQIAAMKPVALDKNDVPQELITKEIEIGKEQAINEGKTPEMAEKIAMGKLNKYFQESTLLNQEFIKDNKKTVKQYLESINKELTVTGFKFFSLAV